MRANLRRELPQLVSDHILRYPHIVIYLAIVDLEDEAHEGGENGCASGLRLDGRDALASLRYHNGETVKGFDVLLESLFFADPTIAFVVGML